MAKAAGISANVYSRYITSTLSWLLLCLQKLILQLVGYTKYYTARGKSLQLFTVKKLPQDFGMTSPYDFLCLHHSFATMEYL